MDPLTDPLDTIGNRVAMVFTPFIHRIAIIGNIRVFRRIRRTATIGPTYSIVVIREKNDSSPSPVEFCRIHAQDVKVD
jgi:hypothetical protein